MQQMQQLDKLQYMGKPRENNTYITHQWIVRVFIYCLKGRGGTKRLGLHKRSFRLCNLQHFSIKWNKYLQD